MFLLYQWQQCNQTVVLRNVPSYFLLLLKRWSVLTFAFNKAFSVSNSNKRCQNSKNEEITNANWDTLQSSLWSQWCGLLSLFVENITKCFTQGGDFIIRRFLIKQRNVQRSLLALLNVCSSKLIIIWANYGIGWEKLKFLWLSGSLDSYAVWLLLW